MDWQNKGTSLSMINTNCGKGLSKNCKTELEKTGPEISEIKRDFKGCTRPNTRKEVETLKLLPKIESSKFELALSFRPTASSWKAQEGRMSGPASHSRAAAELKPEQQQHATNRRPTLHVPQVEV